MEHRVGDKHGSCFSPILFENGVRLSANATKCELPTFDCDRGDTKEEIAASCFSLGYAAVIVSTHSHGSTTLEVAQSEWNRFRGKFPEGSAEQYLQQKKYRECVWSEAEVVGSPENPKVQTLSGEPHITIRHAPCSKYRVFLIARKPWLSSKFDTHNQAAAVYKAGLIQLAKQLGIEADPSCFDLARAFYFPRHINGAPFEAWFVAGGTVDIWSSDAIADSHAVAPRNSSDTPRPTPSGRNERISIAPEIVEDAVRTIKNDGRFDWNGWYRVVAAIHYFFGGDGRGYDLAEEFSDAWTEGAHNPNELGRIWSGFSSEDRPNMARVGTLFHYAKRDGWVLPNLSLCSHLGPHGDGWNGAKFAEQHHNRLLFVEASGQWLEWSNVRWKVITRSYVTGLARSCAQRLYRERKEDFSENGADDARLLVDGLI
ncbi:PriCT-2 domain-containing protein [Ruegeria lacuscaerulensis]|uniref:PriCT-2 domain-containing protein n=1 Tax=Ruegeria lacuscaerulensis TaxID=55218 RepID=UPI00147B840D|nr:PriCT-2 domain-containing protein [Ruegeria lacuscaerulensis]